MLDLNSIYEFIGANEAEKSTTIRIILGLLNLNLVRYIYVIKTLILPGILIFLKRLVS